MKKIFITQSSDVGIQCYKWAKSICPASFEIIEDINKSEIIFSVFHNQIFEKRLLEGKLAVNFHAGLLPKYRGSGTINWIILNGERETAVTLHLIEEDLDSGPIICEKKILVDSLETAGSLYKKMELIVFELFKEWIFKIINGQFEAINQNENEAKLYKRSDLNFAKDLTRSARAFTFPGKESAFFFSKSGKKIFIKYED